MKFLSIHFCAVWVFFVGAMSACSTPEFQYDQKSPDDCCAHYAAKGWCAEERVPGCSGTRMMDAPVPSPAPENTAIAPAPVPEGF